MPEIRTSGSMSVAPWKAHEIRWPGMATAAKPRQQLRTESCVVPGMLLHFKVMSIFVPRIKSDHNGRSGIVRVSTASGGG